jgi:hypothetical protein
LQLVSLTAGLGANAWQQGRRLILLLCSGLSAMLALAGPTYSEDAARESTPNQLPAGQALTISDLEGVRIKIKLVTEMLVQREGGRQGPVTQDTDWNITGGPEGKIDWSFLPTAHTRLGDRVGQKITTTATLDKPWYTPNGEATWQFTDGTLVFVRSFRNGGAYRMSIAFKQDGKNLACSAASTFARERGKDYITMNSAIDGVPVTIFSWKTVSSTCEVTR